MSIKQSVKELTFIPCFLFSHNSVVAYDNDAAEERYHRCVDGLAKMREDAADDVLLRPEL